MLNMSLIKYCAVLFVVFVKSSALEYNYQIKHITKETFIGQEIKDVRLLDFRGCNVETISNTAFDNMTNLNLLMLRNNIIEHLPDGVFNKLKNIETIIVAANKLKHIPEKVFSNLKKLNKIDLSYNSISTIEIGAFDNDGKLENINLRCNKLTEVPVGIFNKLKELTYLDLSDNLLHNIEESALPTFQKLDTLYLHSNKFQHLNKKHVELLTKSTIDKNPWLCDCKLKEVHEKWKTSFHSQGWIPACNAPKNLQNVKWNKLTSDDFVCQPIYLDIFPELYEIPTEIGHSLSLSCFVTGGANVSDIKWTYKNNTEVQTIFQDTSRNFTVQFNTVEENNYTVGVWYNLTINDVKNSDEGIYKCVANQDNRIYELEKRVLVVDTIYKCTFY